jgi:hypothetical protein
MVGRLLEFLLFVVIGKSKTSIYKRTPMYSLKPFRKINNAIFLAILVLYASCSKYEELNPNNQLESSYKLAKEQLQGFQISSLEFSALEKNQKILRYLNRKNSSQLAFSQKLIELNKRTTSEKVEIILNSNIFSSEDLDRFIRLSETIKNEDFHTGLVEFKKEIKSYNLNVEDSYKYAILTNSLRLINDLDSEIFIVKQYSAKELNLDCILATIAFVAACVSLALLEVGTGGLATAAVIIGYIAASTAWVRACK